MDVLVACPRCGECDDLIGRSVDDQIEVECEVCGLTWIREISNLNVSSVIPEMSVPHMKL